MKVDEKHSHHPHSYEFLMAETHTLNRKARQPWYFVAYKLIWGRHSGHTSMDQHNIAISISRNNVIMTHLFIVLKQFLLTVQLMICICRSTFRQYIYCNISRAPICYLKMHFFIIIRKTYVFLISIKNAS